MRILTVADLCDYLGADYVADAPTATSDALSHRMYKATSCGAWCSVHQERRDGKSRRRDYKVHLVQSGREVLVERVEDDRGRVVLPEHWPLKLYEYLCWDQANGGLRAEELSRHRVLVSDSCAGATEDFRGIGPDMGRAHDGDAHMWEVTPLANDRRIATISISRTPKRSAWCVAIGSAVEGSDACTSTVEIDLPCASREIDEAIRATESEAADLWNDANTFEGDDSDEPEEVE